MERPSAINRRKLTTRHKYIDIYPQILNKTKYSYYLKMKKLKNYL